MAPTIAAQILSSASDASPALTKVVDTLAPLAGPLKKVAVFAVDYVLPIYVKAFNLGLYVYDKLPVDLFSALVGLGLSFCGGAYCASIAAIEALRLSGWETTKQALLDVYADLSECYRAHYADDARDDDGDGVPDVKQIDAKALLSRKLAVYALAIKDPNRLATALGGLYAAWLAVQGVLRLEFAKTITLGVAIAEMATPFLQRFAVPLLVQIVPKPYHHWIPLVVQSSARALGVALAWRLQVIISAVHLALRGGLLFSRSLLSYAQAHGYLTSKSHEETYLDEALGYTVAVLGFYCQMSWGFGLPFPLSIFMLPFDGVEWYIRYTITSSAPVA